LYITLENLRNQRFAEGQLLEIIRKPYRSRAPISFTAIGVPACTARSRYGEAVAFVNFVLEVS